MFSVHISLYSCRVELSEGARGTGSCTPSPYPSHPTTLSTKNSNGRTDSACRGSSLPLFWPPHRMIPTPISKLQIHSCTRS